MTVPNADSIRFCSSIGSSLNTVESILAAVGSKPQPKIRVEKKKEMNSLVGKPAMEYSQRELRSAVTRPASPEAILFVGGLRDESASFFDIIRTPGRFTEGALVKYGRYFPESGHCELQITGVTCAKCVGC